MCNATSAVRFMVCTVMMLCLFGCGPKAPPTYPVSGTVTFDGKPVDIGDIIFVPENRALGPDSGKINGGKFTTRTKAGKCRVEISALNIGPDTKYASGSPIASNYIPDCYNIESTLTVEVVADGNNVFDFQLHSR